MNLFECQACGQLLYFENTSCENCGRSLGYWPDLEIVSALEASGPLWTPLADRSRLVRFCSNADYKACNWLVASDDAETFCAACRHNRTVPDLSQSDNLSRWRDIEAAKRRLFYTLMRLGLPLTRRPEEPEGLAFDFLSDPAEGTGGSPMVLTGHDSGLITLNIAEADDAERERRRISMGEPYRTLLGHFRHEVGHYYWNILIRDDPSLQQFREIFGDERTDYGEALKRHYAIGAPGDWQGAFVSAYAGSHPWEDFAETWAHYLHIVDTLDTAGAFGLRVRPAIARSQELSATVDFDPYREPDARHIIQAWLPITFAVNSLNRSMGQLDLYPFVLSPTVIEKLTFIHDRILAERQGSGAIIKPSQVAGETSP